MTCNEVEKRLLRLDRDEKLTPRVAAHLEECPGCRRLAETLEVAESDLLLTSAAEPDLVNSVMAKIERSDIYPTRTRSLLHWFLGGLLLVAALVAVPQSGSFRFLLESVIGPRVDLSVTVVIGLGLVAYLAVFVLAHGERLEEIVDTLVGGSDSGGG